MNFRDYYDEHVTFVWRTLRRLGVPDSYIKDAMQEVHIAAFRKLPEFEVRDNAKNWLYRVCFRAAKDFRRRAHTRFEEFDEEPLLQALDPKADPEASLQIRERLLLMQQALFMLGDEQREAIILYLVEGMTCEEIAGSLDLPLGTVYSRVRLAREAFRRAVTVVAARPHNPDRVETS